MENHFLGNYLDPIAKVWADTASLLPPVSLKKDAIKKEVTKSEKPLLVVNKKQ